jgi:hypothetical protein
VSWRVLHCAANPRAEVKRSTIAIVALDEGPWLYTTIRGELPSSGAAPVRVRFRHALAGIDFRFSPSTPTRAGPTSLPGRHSQTDRSERIAPIPEGWNCGRSMVLVSTEPKRSSAVA